jgi:hypothetical protein
MLMGFIVIVVVGVIAYFHYLEGIFSAALSAVYSLTAALLAVGYHELVVEQFLGGKFADLGHAAALVIIYAVVYIILRVVSDKLITGNAVCPLWVDRIGAAVLGVFAGACGAGIVMIAAQTLPLGPGLLGYSRYPVMERAEIRIRVPGDRRAEEEFAKYEELDGEKFLQSDGADRSKLILPVDDLVLSMVRHVSDENASLSAGRPFADTHPDYLRQLFGQRVGVQTGSRRVATPNTVSVSALAAASSFAQEDQERFELDGMAVGVRHMTSKEPVKPLESTRKAAPGNILLVARVSMQNDIADEKSNMVAYSPASVRLVAARKNYFPIGSLESGQLLYYHAPDDYMFTPGGKSADLVFEVAESDLIAPPTDPKERSVAEGVFLEFKRMARVDLSGKSIAAALPAAAENVEIVRKLGVNPKATLAKVARDPALKAGVKASPLTDLNVTSGSNLPSLGMPTRDREAKNQTAPWGSFSLVRGRLTALSIDPTESLRKLENGEMVVNDFTAGDGNGIVCVIGKPSGDLADKWLWADLVEDFVLVDSNGRKYKPSGFHALATRNGQATFIARHPADVIPSYPDITPTEVTLLYILPGGIDLRNLEFKSVSVQSLQIKTPEQR